MAWSACAAAYARKVVGHRYAESTSLLERIIIDPEVVHGRPAIRGTRVRVDDVLSLLAAGASEEEILDDYPYLAADDIRALQVALQIRRSAPVPPVWSLTGWSV
jgi:uncharacterized protein (DUF433 family)